MKICQEEYLKTEHLYYGSVFLFCTYDKYIYLIDFSFIFV